jgi:hypothetical protein
MQGDRRTLSKGEDGIPNRALRDAGGTAMQMCERMGNVIRLAVSNPAFAIRERAETDFGAVAEFVDFRNNFERALAHEDKLRKLSIATHLAIIVLGRSKTELIELVRSMDNDERVCAAELHRGLSRGRELATTILEMMTAAEARVATALTA